jgi:Glycosyl hydrolase family 9
VCVAPWRRRYNSTSYYDDMTWAATWMYQATKQPTYLNDAISYYVLHSQVPLGTASSLYVSRCCCSAQPAGLGRLLTMRRRQIACHAPLGELQRTLGLINFQHILQKCS